MKGTAQVAKGRVKEAVGALSGDETLRASGRRDQAVGRVKQIAEKTTRSVSASVVKIADAAKDVARKAID